MRKLLLALLFYSPAALADVECLALNIYHEARSESTAGQLGVGLVTLNRVASRKFPNNVCDVVYQGQYSNGAPIKWKCQFSWWCDGVRERVEELEAYQKAKSIAVYLLYNAPLDITDGALYYHSKNVRPYWSEHFTVTTVIDNHIFYKDT